VENSLKVKRAFGISPLKNDIVDSKRIAEYALRFTDKLTLWQHFDTSTKLSDHRLSDHPLRLYLKK